MRSIEVKKGSTRAAHRSLFYAMGYTEEELQKLQEEIEKRAQQINSKQGPIEWFLKDYQRVYRRR